MPPALLAVVPAVIGAGAAVYSASQQKKAAKTEVQAQQQAAQQQLAAQQQAYQTTSALEQPFLTGGQAAFNTLINRYVPGQTQAPTQAQPATQAPASTGPAFSAPDPNQILQDHPDVMQAYQTAINGDASKGIPAADRNSPAFAQAGLTSPQDYAQKWFNGGGSQLYQLPQAATPAPAPQTAAPAPAPVTGGAPDLTNASRPTTAPAPTYTDPTIAPAPTFGPAPQAGDFLDPSKFQTSPGYEWAVQQGQRNLNANFGARGLLKSGAALQGSIDYGQNQANSQYQNWFSNQNSLYNTALGQYNQDRNVGLNQYNADRTTTLNQFNNDRNVGLSQYNTDVTRSDNNFTTDRSFQAGQQQQNTNNLFSLANYGQTAAGNVSNAAGGFANNSSNIYGNQANAIGNAAQQQGSANAGMAGSLAGIGSNLFNSYLGSAGQLTQPVLQTSGFPTMTGGQTTGSFNIPNFSYPTVGAF